MKTVSGVIALSILAGLVTVSCNDTQFGSNSGSPAPATSSATAKDVNPGETDSPGISGDGPGDDGSSSGKDDCVDGDSFVPKFSGPIQKCIDDGLMWNFDAKQCTSMRKAEFDCNFDSFFARLGELGMQPTTKLIEGKEGIKDGKPNKALILGCGESENKQTVLIQWFFTEGTKVGCNFEPGNGLVITGCYGENSGPSAATEEEKTQIVLKCMNGLAQ